MADLSQENPTRCQVETEYKRKAGFARDHGYTVEKTGGFWRVCVPPATKASHCSKESLQVALCLIENDAVNIAYAMAMVRDRARLTSLQIAPPSPRQ
jgi:hypothetical protein